MWWIALLAALLASGSLARAEDALPLSSEEVERRWHDRLDGRHFTMRVRMKMDLAGLREVRELDLYRTDEDGTRERVMIRFRTPPDLRDVSLLYLENDDRPNDYFLYAPATQRVRRLPESAVDERALGVDFEFLGFSIAHSEPTEIEGMERDRIRGRPTYRLRERALERNPRFHERITWIDAETWIPLRTEYRLRERTVMVAETLEIREEQGVPTPVRMRFERPHEDRLVVVDIEAVDYEREIPASVFSVLTLVKSRIAPR